MKRAATLSLLTLMMSLLSLSGCRWGKSAETSTAPTTQTIAPAAAQPAVNGTDAVTQTVDVEDSRSEGEGVAPTNTQTAKKTPPPKTPVKKHK